MPIGSRTPGTVPVTSNAPQARSLLLENDGWHAATSGPFRR